MNVPNTNFTFAQPTLSIICPSHSKDERAYELLLSLTACTQINQNQVEVLISDNSYCDEKRKFLNQLSNEYSNYFVTQGPLNGADNHLHALKSCNGKYVLQIGDDDIVHCSVVAEILNCIKRYDTINLKGIFGPFEQHLENGKSRSFELPNLASELLENRVKSICAAIPYGNPGFQMIWDRDQYLNAYQFISILPYKFFWNDHLLVLHALLKGNFVAINNSYMSFNFGNWTEEQISVREVDFFLHEDAPKSLALVYRIILGFEGAQLILKSTNDSYASSIWFQSWKKAFEMELDRYESQNSLYTDCPKFDIVQRFIDNLYGKRQHTLSDICNDIHNLYLATSDKNKDYRSFWMNRSQIVQASI